MYLNKIIENLSMQKKRLLISIIIFLSVTSLILGIFFFNTSFFYQYLVPPALWDKTIFIFRDCQIILNAESVVILVMMFILLILVTHHLNHCTFMDPYF